MANNAISDEEFENNQRELYKYLLTYYPKETIKDFRNP